MAHGVLTDQWGGMPHSLCQVFAAIGRVATNTGTAATGPVPSYCITRTCKHTCARIHTHTSVLQPCGLSPGLPGWAGTRTNLDFTEARDSEWQWHQLGHMQICILLQTDNHAITPPLSFLQAGCHFCRRTNSVKALKTVPVIASCTAYSEWEELQAQCHNWLQLLLFVGCDCVTNCAVCVCKAVSSGVGTGGYGFGNSGNYATLARPVSLPTSRMQRVLSTSDPDLASSNPTSPDNDMATYSGQYLFRVPPVNVWTMMTLCKVEGKIVRTVVCCTVYVCSSLLTDEYRVHTDPGKSWN